MQHDSSKRFGDRGEPAGVDDVEETWCQIRANYRVFGFRHILEDVLQQTGIDSIDKIMMRGIKALFGKRKRPLNEFGIASLHPRPQFTPKFNECSVNRVVVAGQTLAHVGEQFCKFASPFCHESGPTVLLIVVAYMVRL